MALAASAGSRFVDGLSRVALATLDARHGDTTVALGTTNGRPDTFVITGDIHAMWLRDSTAQVWPYLRFAREDPRLALLLRGVVMTRLGVLAVIVRFSLSLAH